MKTPTPMLSPAAALLVLASALTAHSAPLTTELGSPQARTVLTENTDFERNSLLAPEYRSGGVSGLSFSNPNRFSMRQSYSMNFSSSSYGSQSSGLYLNTLSYRLANPLTLSADVGFHTPLYSSSFRNSGEPGLLNGGRRSSLVFPRIGLEYKPSERTSFSVQLFNGQDAARAYGSAADPFWNPWYR